MYKKLIINDMKKSKLITVTITVFILFAALLTSLAAILCVNLFSAIDTMMVLAKTPHFMQMHSGEVDMERLGDFANAQSNVEEFQVSEFLNIEGAEIKMGEETLAISVQDNGLCVQSKKFDFLLDLTGDMIAPADGEIYVPIYYMKEGLANVGDSVNIHGESFKVAGFLRDSQMNPAMISSKRFLVNENDFEKIRNFGKLEKLIEFRLYDPSGVSTLESAYLDAGMEANGPPAISYTLFKMANAISDGMMIAVLLLIGILVIIVSFLCVRFTLLAKIEEDYREIGVLKAIGLRVSSIKKLYLAKYGVISAVACILGFIGSLFVKEPLMENIRLYMGESNNLFLSLLLGAIGAVCIFVVVVLYVHLVLGNFKKLSAAEAIRFGAPKEKTKTSKRFRLSKNKLFSPNVFLGIKDVLSKKKLYVTIVLVIIISAFIMIVPQNIYNTISSRSFMTYMGIGECDMRIDIQQTDNIAEKTAEIAAVMAGDESIAKHTVLTSYMFDTKNADGFAEKLKIELGDHRVFPIEYSAGRAAETESEIAISTLVADDLEKKVGDSIVITAEGLEKQLTVCGIYSDITNNGKTAKAVFEAGSADVLWSIIPVQLQDISALDGKIAEYKERFSFAKIADIDEYINQTFGATMDAMKKTSYASIMAAIALCILVTLLFMKMLVTKDKYGISVLKSVGFRDADIRKQYIIRAITVSVIGIIIGTILANTVGEFVGAALISSFGASAFHFEINPLFAYLFSPLAIAASVSVATFLGISDIGKLKIAENIKE